MMLVPHGVIYRVITEGLSAASSSAKRSFYKLTVTVMLTLVIGMLLKAFLPSDSMNKFD